MNLKNCVLALDMKQGNSHVVTDISNSHNNGIISGARRFWNTGLLFDGNDYVDCTNDASLQFYDAFTISVWFKQTTETGSYDPIITRGGNSNGGFMIGIENGSDHIFIFRNGGSTYADVNYTILKNKWYHVTAVHYADDTFKAYIDGIERLSAGGFDYLTPFILIVYLGFWGGYNQYFNGFIDDVRIYSGLALSANEVKKRYYESKLERSNALIQK